MSEEKKIVELNDEELEKVSGGFVYGEHGIGNTVTEKKCQYYNSTTKQCEPGAKCQHLHCIMAEKKEDFRQR